MSVDSASVSFINCYLNLGSNCLPRPLSRLRGNGFDGIDQIQTECAGFQLDSRCHVFNTFHNALSPGSQLSQ